MISIRVIDMEKRVIYYARVSSKDQNLVRQLEAFCAAGAGDEDIIYDVCTGANMDRPEYQPLKKPEEWDVYYKRWCHKDLSVAKCGREMNISKSSFYRLARKETEENRG